MTISISGTHRVGTLDAPFQDLIDCFGEPDCYGSPDGKTQVEWRRKVDGNVFAIYDYRSSNHFTDNTQWSVGGYNYDAMMTVGRLMENYALAMENLAS